MTSLQNFKIEKPKPFYLTCRGDFKEFKKQAEQIGEEFLPHWRTSLKIGGNLWEKFLVQSEKDSYLKTKIQKMEQLAISRRSGSKTSAATVTIHTPPDTASIPSTSTSSISSPTLDPSCSSSGVSFSASTVPSSLSEKEIAEEMLKVEEDITKKAEDFKNSLSGNKDDIDKKVAEFFRLEYVKKAMDLA